jgi:hypothetical protein
LDEAGRPLCTPLADNSGFLTFQTTGAWTLDDHLGPDEKCHAMWAKDGLIVSFAVPVFPTDASQAPKGVLGLTVTGLTPGVTGGGNTTSVDFIAGPSIWLSDTCSATITVNERIGSSSSYKIAGSVQCSGPLPEISGAYGITVEKLEFVVSARPSM